MGTPNFNDPDMQEIFDGFLVETNELLDAIANDLMVLEKQPDDLELLNKIFRSFHTIKGTSSFMGFAEIADITHHAEDILNKLRRSELKVSLEIIDVLLEVHDIIQHLIETIGEGTASDYSDVIAKIDAIRDSGLKQNNTAENNNNIADESANIQPSAASDADQNNDVSNSATELKHDALDKVISNKQDIIAKPGDFTQDELALLDQAFNEVNAQFSADNQDFLSEIISDNNDVQNSVDKSTHEEEPENDSDKVEKNNSETTAKTQSNVTSNTKNPPSSQADVSEPIHSNSSSTALHNTSKGKNNSHLTASSADTIRIDVSRIETLMDLSGELVLGRNRLTQMTETFNNVTENKDLLRNLVETTSQIDFITSEIQAAVMRMRMVPIAKLYQKAPRIVRDLSKEFNKKIDLQLSGEETEIDRGIIEELNDPLVHMIRNSCDHGIESPEEREQVGKPPVGTILLDAEQEGNNIVIRISDDGKGMDTEKLKAKAVEKGMISAEAASQMTTREAFNLIFAPGFSTAAVVSNVSGRGVGMDVVRSNIQKLKGMIDIESELGVGTTFIIKLPLTLAIIQGLLVRIQNETYAIPLSSVVEVVHIDPTTIYTVNRQEVIKIREDVDPLIRLDKVLNTKEKIESLDNRYVVIVGLGLKRIGIVVDELLGQQEIVIKSLGEYLGHISGIAGSTILGDGRVIMIIDVAELISGKFANQFTNY